MFKESTQHTAKKAGHDLTKLKDKQRLEQTMNPADAIHILMNKYGDK